MMTHRTNGKETDAMNSNVVSLFKDGRIPQSSINRAWLQQSNQTERPSQAADKDTNHAMVSLTGLSEAEWDKVFGDGFIIF